MMLQVAKPQAPKPIELDTLKIEGKIYEPQVLFVLEKPSLDLITIEVDNSHNFLEDLEAPLKDLR